MKIIMRRIAGASLIAMLVAASYVPGSAAPASTATQRQRTATAAGSALAADRAFAAMAAKDGPAAAFAAWYAADGAFIDQGQITRGVRAVASGFGDFRISWEPDEVHASVAGDLAVTTGRYSIMSSGNLVEAGRYLTVWRRTDRNGWKVMIGSKDPDPATRETSAEAARRKSASSPR